MTVNDTIKAPSRGSVATVMAWARKTGASRLDFLAVYFDHLWRLCERYGLDFAVLVAQWADETDGGKSALFRETGNPAGIGKFPDGTYVGGVFTPERAARAHVSHMLAYLGIDAGEMAADDPRYDAVRQAGFWGVVTRLRDLGNGRWATNPNYASQIAARANRIFDNLFVQGATDMALPIPRFEKRIAPQGIPNRTGLWMNPEDVVIHEVGNLSPGADEEMHTIFVHNGGGENVVSFHFINGPTKVVQLFELDVACWHAGDGYNGRGNRRGIAIENVQVGDFDRTLWHLAWLCAELVTNPGRFAWKHGVPDPYLITENTFNQHANYMLKNCPQFIRDRGLWPVLMSRIDQYIAAAKPAPEPKPKPEPAPKPIPEPPKTHTLPKGMSPQLAARLYERYDAPWGESFVFDLGRAAPQVWLSRAKRSIPKGGTWTDANWPALTEVIRRGKDGDQGLVYRWADGSTYESKAA